MAYNPVTQHDPSPGYFDNGPQKPSEPHVSAYETYSSSLNNSTSPPADPVQKSSTWKSRLSIASPAWEHPLSKKHLSRAPSDSESTRYFDRTRQTRRVFIDGLVVWSATAIVCAGMFGVLYYFSHKSSISQQQKYEYNASITGLSILLGLTFAAQFKQYCEFMRWRFLASGYRTVTEFDDVLGCDGWRTTLKLIFQRHGKGSRWYPAKSQLLAFAWLLIFIIFNVLVALIGLTYSIDVSTTVANLVPGNVSVAELKYVSHTNLESYANYSNYRQISAASIWGITGQSYTPVIADFGSEGLSSRAGDTMVFTTEFLDTFWHKFVDYHPDLEDLTNYVTSTRSVNVTAVCEELQLTQGGYAGFDGFIDAAGNPDYTTSWIDSAGQNQSKIISTVQTSLTTWMGNMTSDCGPRCITILALQTANNLTTDNITAMGLTDQTVAVPSPRLWQCNNTVDQVNNYDGATEGFDNPELLMMPDIQAQILAGAIGWSGQVSQDDKGDMDELQYNIVRGDDPWYNLPGEDNDAASMAAAVMKYTAGAIAAIDQPSGLRQNASGTDQPQLAQVVNVKWNRAGPILAGLPGAQFLMLLVVVWFTRKAIILEPSALTFAHLLYPVIKEVGERGVLMSADEIEEKLGDGFKVSYSVRPDPADPGPHEKDHVRRLQLLKQSEGFGYVRGAMPEGRYA